MAAIGQALQQVHNQRLATRDFPSLVFEQCACSTVLDPSARNLENQWCRHPARIAKRCCHATYHGCRSMNVSNPQSCNDRLAHATDEDAPLRQQMAERGGAFGHQYSMGFVLDDDQAVLAADLRDFLPPGA